MFIAAGLMFVLSEDTSPKVLCPDRITATVKQMGYLFSILIIIIILVIAASNLICDCCKRSCDRCKDQYICCSFPVLFYICVFLLLFLPLLVCSMWLNFHGMNMIVQNPTDEAIYRCEGVQENPDAHRILFKPNNGTTNHLNQGCDFWSIDALCDPLVCAFQGYSYLVKVNGILGAYRCSDSSPEGHDVCVSYLGVALIYSYIQTTLAYVSIPLLVILSIWIVIRDQSDDCARRCDCCVPKGSRYKLIPQKVASVFEDKYFSI